MNSDRGEIPRGDVQNLVRMGFKEDSAIYALMESDFNFDHALDLLLSGRAIRPSIKNSNSNPSTSSDPQTSTSPIKPQVRNDNGGILRETPLNLNYQEHISEYISTTTPLLLRQLSEDSKNIVEMYSALYGDETPGGLNVRDRLSAASSRRASDLVRGMAVAFAAGALSPRDKERLKIDIVQGRDLQAVQDELMKLIIEGSQVRSGERVAENMVLPSPPSLSFPPSHPSTASHPSPSPFSSGFEVASLAEERVRALIEQKRTKQGEMVMNSFESRQSTSTSSLSLSPLSSLSSLSSPIQFSELDDQLDLIQKQDWEKLESERKDRARWNLRRMRGHQATQTIQNRTLLYSLLSALYPSLASAPPCSVPILPSPSLPSSPLIRIRLSFPDQNQTSLSLPHPLPSPSTAAPSLSPSPVHWDILVPPSLTISTLSHLTLLLLLKPWIERERAVSPLTLPPIPSSLSPAALLDSLDLPEVRGCTYSLSLAFPKILLASRSALPAPPSSPRPSSSPDPALLPPISRDYREKDELTLAQALDLDPREIERGGTSHPYTVHLHEIWRVWEADPTSSYSEFLADN